MTTNPRIRSYRNRRLTAGRLAVFLLIIAGIVIWQGLKKIPTGPAEGSALMSASATTEPAGDSLRVATFNVDGGAEGLDRVVHALGGTGAGFSDGRGFDLIGLQEVHGLDQTGILGQSLQKAYLYAPVETQWRIKSFGNAAITSLPVNYWERIPISSNESDSNRNVILLQVKFAGKPVNVLITHIDRKQDHATEIRDVSHLFLAMQEPAILMGDFNLTTDSSGNDADPDVAMLANTPGVVDPIGKEYDRIFARGLVAVKSGYVEEHASDHPLAWSEFKLATD